MAQKEIQGRHADHPESWSRFLLEAEITGGLEHPDIVPVYCPAAACCARTSGSSAVP